MSGTRNGRPTSSNFDPESGATGPSSAKRRWLPLALIGAAVVVVIVVVVVFATSAANQGGPTKPGGALTSGSGTAVPTKASSSDSSPTASPGDGATDPTAAVGAEARTTSEPHPFDAPADVTTGVTATVGNITSVQGVASGVGETAGPAIRFEVTMTNNTAQAIDLDFTNVLVDYGVDLTPGSQMSGNTDLVALPGSLASGESATAAYVFTVPTESRESVRITVDYLASVPFAVFVGAVPAS